MAAYKLSLPPKEMAFLTVMYTIGGTVAHSAACVINDICDRDFDGQVGESKFQPSEYFKRLIDCVCI